MAPEHKRQQTKRNGTTRNIVLIAIVIIISTVPLFMLKNAEFNGADTNAEKAINEINAGYKPWFSPIWRPPSGEVESFFFAVQAALGAGFIGYYLGYMRGRKKKEEVDNSDKYR